jgi:hypothetical protein
MLGGVSVDRGRSLLVAYGWTILVLVAFGFSGVLSVIAQH